MAIQIKQGLFADPSNFASGASRPLSSIKYIVVHYTGNDGDSDEANANYSAKTPNVCASAHYFVDDDSITQSVPDDYASWSVGKDYSGGKAPLWGKCTNANSINVEMCDTKKDGKYAYSAATYANTVELVRLLKNKFNITIENLVRHYDVCGKICPAWFVGAANEAAWNAFKTDVYKSTTITPAYLSGVSDWACEAWEWAKNAGFCDGTRPKETATREEIITLFYRFKGLK
ncbi:hypothetical protein FACS189490_04520 [Clostridia bacterium]|nr:hypothetical protein FACS189490_04520 [Clostridia bacterium]